MNELERWLAGEARREGRAVYLEETLLGSRFWAYSWYRLRYFFVRYAVATLTHAVTVLLLYRFFDRTHFVIVLFAYAVAAVVSSFWWGALEALRTEVRRLYRLRVPHLIPKAIGGWLSLSLQLTFLTALGTVAWLVVHVLHGGSFNPATLYVVAIGIRLALQFSTRAYHSGIYAIRRVYRPLPAIVGVEFAGIGTAVVLAPLIGAWALPIGALAGAAVVTGLSVYYTSRAYWFLGVSPLPFITPLGLHLPPRRSLRDFFGGGISYGLIAIDSLIVLVLFTTERADAGKTGLFALFFLLSPTVRAAFEWAQLMYFDLKRLELRLFRNLKLRFERHVLRLAVGMGVVFAGVAGLVGALVYRGSLGDLGWTLVPFFVSISLLAAVQIEAYAEQAYPALIANAGLCLVGYVGVAHYTADDRTTVLLLAAVACCGFGLLLLRRERLQGGGAHALESRMEWLAGLAAVRGSVRVSAARFYADRRAEDDSWRRQQVSQRIARSVTRGGAATLAEPDLLVWYERDEQSTIGEQSLPAIGGGLVQWVGARGGESGLDALRAAGGAGLLGRELAEVSIHPPHHVDTEELRATFAEMFTSGIVYSPDEHVPPRLDALPSKDKRVVLREAIAFARELHVSRPRSRFHVTSFCEGGELRLIFLVSRQAPQRLCSRWEALVRRANLEAARSPEASQGGTRLHPKRPRIGLFPVRAKTAS